MNISAQNIASKKQVGTLKGQPVIALKTTGGFNLIVVARDGSFDTLGTGSHPAISRHIAEKREPEIQWSELSKSDYLGYESFAFLLPQYEELTMAMRAMQGLGD